MFKKAIVRTPSKSMVDGLTTAGLGTPDYLMAIEQHERYIEALRSCAIDVIILEADEHYPDSVFVEDVALVTKKCAIITNPGAASRKGETTEMKEVLSEYYTNLEYINEPGTVDAGDIMMVGSHFYIGLSARTNLNGANQLISILEKYGMSGSVLKVENALHLKTGVAYLDRNNLVASGEFLKKEELRKFNILEIENEESYASNCIFVNGVVLIPSGYPKTKNTIKEAGYFTIELDMSEFRKLDGGLSCLSLRF